MANDLRDMEQFKKMPEGEFRLLVYIKLCGIEKQLENKALWRLLPLVLLSLAVMISLVVAIAK